MARWNKYVDENGSHFTDSETELSFMRFSSNRAAIKLSRLSLSKRLQRSTIIRDWTQKVIKIIIRKKEEKTSDKKFSSKRRITQYV